MQRRLEQGVHFLVLDQFLACVPFLRKTILFPLVIQYPQYDSLPTLMIESLGIT